MNEKRKQWSKKYITGEYLDKYCLPEHVERHIPPTYPREDIYFIGLDGRKTTYENLTEEEKRDWEEQLVQAEQKWKEKFQPPEER